MSAGLVSPIAPEVQTPRHIDNGSAAAQLPTHKPINTWLTLGCGLIVLAMATATHSVTVSQRRSSGLIPGKGSGNDWLPFHCIPPADLININIAAMLPLACAANYSSAIARLNDSEPAATGKLTGKQHLASHVRLPCITSQSHTWAAGKDGYDVEMHATLTNKRVTCPARLGVSHRATTTDIRCRIRPSLNCSVNMRQYVREGCLILNNLGDWSNASSEHQADSSVT